MDWLLLCMEKFELIRYNEKKRKGSLPLQNNFSRRRWLRKDMSDPCFCGFSRLAAGLS